MASEALEEFVDKFIDTRRWDPTPMEYGIALLVARAVEQRTAQRCAAPELLEALEDVAKCFFDSEDGLCAECGYKLGVTGLCLSCSAYCKAESAIRKAKEGVK